ncbi:hypothetical protein PLICRDRAFT_36518 [Plicaturopsis crispa FD-325 SS-3]|nr:hypothetical protein PLICRDRAFT_36518 [Plicaturopsis crispa FD-325 SS-3]
MSESPRKIVIVGAGVIGLTIAHLLTAETSKTSGWEVSIVARDMPGDVDSTGWASPWAGANWSPIGGFDKRVQDWEKVTFNKLWDMIPSGLVMSLPSRVYSDEEVAVPTVWYEHLVRDFAVIPADEVPSKYKTGLSYKTLSVNPNIYMPWLKSELDSRGVQFTRRTLASLDQAAELAGAEGIIINATSLGARSLIGVEDTAVYPIRGQTIHVYAPTVKEFLSDTSPAGAEHITYIIPRPGPDDTVLLGGTYQSGSWDTSFDGPTAAGIFERCAALAPSLKEDPRTRILAHGVGLRPGRKGGPRVEVEWVELPLKGALVPTPGETLTMAHGKRLVIHAYGFGGAGYQNSWGAAEEVQRLLEAHI